MKWELQNIHGTNMEKQLLLDVHVSRSFTSHLGKARDVQIKRLLAYMQYLYEKELLEEFLFMKTPVIRKGLVWFG